MLAERDEFQGCDTQKGQTKLRGTKKRGREKKREKKESGRRGVFVRIYLKSRQEGATVGVYKFLRLSPAFIPRNRTRASNEDGNYTRSDNSCRVYVERTFHAARSFLSHVSFAIIKNANCSVTHTKMYVNKIYINK